MHLLSTPSLVRGDPGQKDFSTSHNCLSNVTYMRDFTCIGRWFHSPCISSLPLNNTWTHGEISFNTEELPRNVVESGSKLLSHLYTVPQFLSVFPYYLEFLPYRKDSCSFMGIAKQSGKRLTCRGKETHKPRLNWDFSATDVIAQYPILQA